MDHTQIRSYFDSQKPWLVKFLSDLLAIPSESGKEARAQRRLLQQLQEAGIDCQWQGIDNTLRDHPQYSFPVRDLDYTGRGNLVLRKAGSGKHLALNTHVDVVPPSPGQAAPYLPHVDEEDRIWARGACDAKGQIAAMALLFKAVNELGGNSNALTGHVVVEEELGGNGTLAVLAADRDFSADAIVNLEPTDLRLCPSIRGAVWFEMTFEGIAGHAGSSENTVSATDKAIGAVSLLKQYHKELLERSKDYGLYKGMTNPMPLTIGKFQAGVWPAMVPGRAAIAGVLGFLSNTTREAVMDELKELFDREENRWISQGMKMEFVYRHNAVETPVDHWFVTGMAAACECCGIDGTPTAMTASSDGVFYQERGIPAMAFGPGRISDAHSCHEYVKLDDVLRAAEILYTFYRSM